MSLRSENKERSSMACGNAEVNTIPCVPKKLNLYYTEVKMRQQTDQKQ
jgi:hypothetical protein